ncbi:hypothetical protein [Dactylosporangium salmoneum]|uniref:Uncharacterized protein n=1 Tax=Dactylosporangium salmoneum TaxID=53361 RepID=A0ABN3GB04_9ACTN
MTEAPEQATARTTAEDRIHALGTTYEGVIVHEGGKRCGLQWTPWVGDWFVSYSPRNGNSHAEGHWDHWVDLALYILRDPMTAKVRPAAHAAVAGVEPLDLYTETGADLSYEDLAERFAPEVDRANGGVR